MKGLRAEPREEDSFFLNGFGILALLLGGGVSGFLFDEGILFDEDLLEEGPVLEVLFRVLRREGVGMRLAEGL